jgi:16S rRNA U1498 N3-methylase RsmE
MEKVTYFGEFMRKNKRKSPNKSKRKGKRRKKELRPYSVASMLKSPSRLDWLVEKLTEIGVTRIGSFFPITLLKILSLEGRKQDGRKSF